MQAYDEFDQLACAATSHYNVNTSTFYGRIANARTTGTALWWVVCKGRGLPEDGFRIGAETPAAAVAAMTSQLKRNKATRAQEQVDRDRAARATSELQSLQQAH